MLSLLYFITVLLGCVEGLNIQRGTSNASLSANDTAQALLYGYPLALYVQTFYPIIQEKGTNVPKNENNTASASASSLVRPNANYVYSPMAVDLSHDNVVITVPDISDGRSYVFPFYDLYGNNFANLGSATSSPPGDYLMRPAGSRTPGLTMLNASSADSNGYKGVIDFATAYGSMEIRILLLNNGSDLNTLHGYQNEIKIKTIPRNAAPIGPRLTESLLDNGELSTAPYSPPTELDSANATSVLKLLAKLAPYNPPANKALAAGVDQMLSRAGIANGVYNDAGFNITAVNDIILQETAEVLTPNPSSAAWVNYGHGWWGPSRAQSGKFHSAYLTRAFTAYRGYLELVHKQALYPEYFGSDITSGAGTLEIGANESYLFTFSETPPAQFWSMTLYGSTNYLIPNPLNRYDLSSTSKSLRYPNGKDGPFQILVQPANKSPPANWTGNWLPCESGGGEFALNFRTYGPFESMLNGSYPFPVVTKQGLFE